MIQSMPHLSQTSGVAASLLDQITKKVPSKGLPVDPAKRAFLSQVAAALAEASQGERNMKDAASLLQTAEHGVSSIHAKLGDVERLLTDMQSIKAQNPSVFAAMKQELDVVLEDIEATVQGTEFNGIHLLRDGFGRDGLLQVQAGNTTITQQMTNFADKTVAAGVVVDGNKINLSHLKDMLKDVDQRNAGDFREAVRDVSKRVLDVQAEYGYTSKRMENTAISLGSHADVLSGVLGNHTPMPHLGKQTARPTVQEQFAYGLGGTILHRLG